MSDEQIRKIADQADMIVNGYAFTKKDGNICVVNINKPNNAMYMTSEGKMLETNMDEIEQMLVLKIWERDSEYMEAANA